MFFCTLFTSAYSDNLKPVKTPETVKFSFLKKAGLIL